MLTFPTLPRAANSQDQNQKAYCGSQIPMDHFNPSFAVRHGTRRHGGLCRINVHHCTQGAGTAITAGPIWAAQTRIGEACKRPKQDQIEREKQSEYRHGTQFGIDWIVSIAIKGEGQRQHRNEHAHTQQTQCG